MQTQFKLETTEVIAAFQAYVSKSQKNIQVTEATLNPDRTVTVIAESVAAKPRQPRKPNVSAPKAK